MSFNRFKYPRALSLSLALLLLCNFCLLNFHSLRVWMGEGVYQMTMGIMISLTLLLIGMMIFYQRRAVPKETNMSRSKFFLRRAGIPVAMMFLVLGLLWKRMGFAASMGENFSDFIMGLCFGLSIALNILTMIARRNPSCDGMKVNKL